MHSARHWRRSRQIRPYAPPARSTGDVETDMTQFRSYCGVGGGMPNSAAQHDMVTSPPTGTPIKIHLPRVRLYRRLYAPAGCRRRLQLPCRTSEIQTAHGIAREAVSDAGDRITSMSMQTWFARVQRTCSAPTSALIHIWSQISAQVYPRVSAFWLRANSGLLGLMRR